MWEGKGGMIWENSTEAYTLQYVNQITSVNSMHEARHWKSVLWDNLGGEGGGSRIQDAGGYLYTYGSFMFNNIWQKPSTIVKYLSSY